MIREFFKPSSVEEAIKQKETCQNNACWFGNGTFINNGCHEFPFESVIALEKLNLSKIKDMSAEIIIGATVTLQDLMDSAHIPDVLKQAAGHETSKHIRNMKTIGGDIGIGMVLSNTIPTLIALSASVHTPGATLLIEDYLASKSADLILDIQIPKKNIICHIKKVSLQSNSPTIFTTAASLEKNNDVIKNVIIAVGGIKGDVFRLKSLEAQLVNGSIKSTDKDLIKEAVSGEIHPVSDINGSFEYKKYIAGITILDCIEHCFSGLVIH